MPASRIYRIGATLLWLALSSAQGAPAVSTPSLQELDDARRARAEDLAAQQTAAEKARAASERERALAERRVETATHLRAAEQAQATQATRVADLTRQAAAAQAALAARAAAFVPLLPVIERLSLYPVETLLAVPMPPEDSVRGVLVLRNLAGRLERQAAALRDEQAHVVALRAELDAALPALRAARAEQDRLGRELDAELDAARRARVGAEDAATLSARRAAADAERADTIAAALVHIEAERRAAETRVAAAAAAAASRAKPPAAPAAPSRRDAEPRQQEATARLPVSNMREPRGQLTAPVAGSVIRAFGAETEAGPATGMTWQALSGARVVSPCGGQIVFAGPFRSFGLLMIVDCGNGYHFVLSGLERLDGQVGQIVQPGEPVGIMPAWDGQNAGASRSTLYVELRKDGVAVNPAPFLRARS